MPAHPINKGLAEAGLVAWLIIQKFVYQIPFYRSIAQLKQLYQVKIAKTSDNDWFIAGFSAQSIGGVAARSRN